MFCASAANFIFLNYLTRIIIHTYKHFREEFVKFHIFIFLAIIIFSANLLTVSAQVDSVIGQITSSAQESFAGGISGDGRLVVFESAGDIATENPRNADGNREIFIFDYAQRRIFQITNTKSLLTDTTLAATADNVKVVLANLHPTISNDGRWIAFGSNANSIATPLANVTPGNFDANSLTDSAGANPLTLDGNTELWLYQVPAVAPVNLSSGSEIPITDLSAGTFTRVTNTAPSRVPTAGSTTIGPVIADDNRDASINDNGNYVSFTSNRDLITGGNASPDNNDEIFTYVRLSNTIAQVTKTTRGTLAAPIYNQSPTISGNGLRVTFLSNAENPVIGMTGGSNADGNVEIYYTDLNAGGTPAATAPSASVIGRQVTTTTRTNPGDLVNILDFGRRMSRDGRYIAFDSYADLASENGGTNQTSFALYLFDTTLTTGAFRRIGPRSDADSASTGGDVSHFPGFTDYNSSGAAQTLVFESRENFKADGTIPATASDGLNSDVARPVQIFSYPLNVAPASATFTRLTKLPAANTFLGLTQPIPSNTVNRMTFNLAFTEVGTGNTDLQTEAFYFLLPVATNTSTTTFSFTTGASLLPVSATPTPTPTTTPTPTPTPSVTPTPQTPATVLGVSPGLLTYINFDVPPPTTLTGQTAIGSLQRRFTLPIELNGITVSINGAAAGIEVASQTNLLIVVPPGLSADAAGTAYSIVINNNGTVFRGTITVVPARPDIFTTTIPGPGGRARIFNATNRVLTGEPFTVSTVKIKGGTRGPTVLRVFLTGVEGVPSSAISIRVGTVDISGSAISAPVLREPGIYSIDFTLPSTLRGVGDVPIIVTVTSGSVTFQSRLEDTAPRFRIL